MAGQEEPIIHSYKISVDHRWDLFNANALVQALLGRQPERWHLEKCSRHTRDLLGRRVTYTWHLIHAKHDGSWQRRYIPHGEARKLQQLGITAAATHNPER